MQSRGAGEVVTWGYASTVAGSKREIKRSKGENAELWAESKIFIRTKASHVDGVQGSRPLAHGNIGRGVVMLQSVMHSEYMRSEERSVLVVWSIAISSHPWPILPEASIRLLISKKIVVVWMGVRSVHRELIGGLESRMRPAKARTRRICVERHIETREKRRIVYWGDVDDRILGLLC